MVTLRLLLFYSVYELTSPSCDIGERLKHCFVVISWTIFLSFVFQRTNSESHALRLELLFVDSSYWHSYSGGIGKVVVLRCRMRNIKSIRWLLAALGRKKRSNCIHNLSCWWWHLVHGVLSIWSSRPSISSNSHHIIISRNKAEI